MERLIFLILLDFGHFFEWLPWLSHTLALASSQDIAFEFREAAQNIEKQLGERVVVILGECQIFLHEFYGNAFRDQLTDDVLQILEAAG